MIRHSTKKLCYFYLSIVIVIVISILISGCVAENQKSREVITVQEKKNDTDSKFLQTNDTSVKDTNLSNFDTNNISLDNCKLLNEIERDECYLNKAKTMNDFSICKKIVSSDVTDKCYSELAQISKNSSELCFEIRDSGRRQECYFLVAVKFNDSSFCKRISDLALLRKCSQQISSKCYAYDNVAQINRCLSLELNNSVLCENDELCLIDFAVKSNNILTCDLISNEETNKACLTLTSGDDYCAGIKDLKKRYNCYDIAANLSNNMQFCNMIDSSTLLHKDCYIRTVINQKKSHLCDNVYAPHNRKVDYVNECYLKYALTNNDVNACLNISIRMDRIPCITKVAYGLNDPTICNYVETLTEKTRCYGNIVYGDKELDANKCIAIEITEWKHNCLITSAFRTKNETLCMQIDKTTYPDTYQRCVSSAK
ncbi:MAG: hypothetical protein N3E37_00950 [Candidatus Micrarchaeota archaeon]|nr:hypothetical protein [Candidatus Micrarchaeota archaeon]